MSILSRVCLRSISLRIPLDERLVPVSRVDYQNIILYIYMRVCVRAIAIDRSGKRILSPQAKESK